MERPKVSVACVVYNQEKYAKDCLESLVCQKTDFDYEIIVHDDASTDSTPEIVKKYAEGYPSIIKPIYERENQYSKNPKLLNDIIYPKLQGDYFAFIEGDDYWCDERKLQKQFDAMEANPRCSMCTHNVARIREDGTPTHSVIGANKFSAGIISGDEFIKAYFTDGEEFQTSSYFIKRNVILSMPRAMIDTYYVGDVPMLLWSMLNGDMYYIDSVSSCYRVMAANSTNRALKDKDYAIMRLRTSMEGSLAFNELSGHKYWEYMKKDVMRKKAQIYFADKSLLSEAEKMEVMSELSFKEKLTARIKFSRIGNILRNIRQDVNSHYG